MMIILLSYYNASSNYAGLIGKQSSSVNPVSTTNSIGRSARFGIRNGMVIIGCPSATMPDDYTLHDTTTKSSSNVVPNFAPKESSMGVFLVSVVSST
jgi:hypothetical protein